MTGEEWWVHCMVDIQNEHHIWYMKDEEWISLVCRLVLARLRIEMTGLQIESDQFCIDFMVDVWNEQQSEIFGRRLKIAGLQNRNGSDQLCMKRQLFVELFRPVVHCWHWNCLRAETVCCVMLWNVYTSIVYHSMIIWLVWGFWSSDVEQNEKAKRRWRNVGTEQDRWKERQWQYFQLDYFWIANFKEK